MHILSKLCKGSILHFQQFLISIVLLQSSAAETIVSSNVSFPHTNNILKGENSKAVKSTTVSYPLDVSHAVSIIDILNPDGHRQKLKPNTKSIPESV